MVSALSWKSSFKKMNKPKGDMINIVKIKMEKRKVYEDFKRIFGSEPPNVGASAIMSDSDNIGGVAEAFYDDIILLKQ